MNQEKIAEYAQTIVESKASDRVVWLINAVRDNMLSKNTRFQDMGSVLNEETCRLPVIIRKAMAERQKLSRVPVGIWDRQIFAGCFTLRDDKCL